MSMITRKYIAGREGTAGRALENTAQVFGSGKFQIGQAHSKQFSYFQLANFYDDGLSFIFTKTKPKF